MKVSETALLESGFSQAELQKIKKTVECFGGTLEEAINDLASRFSGLLFFTGFFCVVFFLAVAFTPQKAIGVGVSSMIVLVIISFAQPLVISYKSWRYRKFAKN